MDAPSDLELARRAARAGAEVVRDAFGIDRAHFKGEVDPVTEADHASEAAILAVLRSYRPDDGIIAEEAGGVVVAGRRWLVDPLDGTVNFLHGVPHVAVSVALYEGDEPRVGAVVDVFRDEEYWAESGGGGALSTTGPLEASRGRLSESLVGTGFPYDRREHAAAYVRTTAAVLEAARDVRRMGTAAIDLAWVAGGQFGGFWEYGLGPWDVAAGILLIREAGGTVTDHTGAAAVPGCSAIVAAGPVVHPDLLGLVTATLPEHLR